jgi:hypothetical protein
MNKGRDNQYLLVVSDEYGSRSTLLGVYTTPVWDMHTVAETDGFLRDAKSLRLTEDERDTIVNYMAAYPQEGDEVSGTGGARKVRFPGKGKGKSGGYRVFTFYSGEDIPVFLMRIISKGDRENLTPAQHNDLKADLSMIVKGYRERK